jgi:hypothetical protein
MVDMSSGPDVPDELRLVHEGLSPLDILFLASHDGASMEGQLPWKTKDASPKWGMIYKHRLLFGR